jgi:signal transduction histidine kinase
MTPEHKLHRSVALQCLRVLLLLPLFGCPLAGQIASGQESGVLLTNGAQVLSLSAERAALGVRVFVTGVVTAAEPTWGGRFFVQDSTGGVFVENLSDHQPKPGDWVEVAGVSHPGAFAPIITKPHWKTLGTAPMPKAKAVPMEQLMSGTEDGQRVEICGIVRAAEVVGNRLRVTIASGGYRLRMYLILQQSLDLQTIVGATIRARGTAAADFNAELRHLITMIVYISQAEDFTVEKAQLTNPFFEPVMPLNNIAQYRKDSTPGQRVHIKGTVTYQRLGQDLFLKDATGGLHIESPQREIFSAGDVIEAVGFADFENFLPVLRDAVFRKTSEARRPVAAEAVSINKLRAGLHHADFMALEGNLLDRSVRPVRQPTNGPMRFKTTLLLQTENFSFTAEAETPAADPPLASIPIGSRVEVSGVCLTESGDDGRFKSLQVLLPTSESFRVLSKPSWVTARHLGIALGVFFLVSVVAVSWIIMIYRKNAELNNLVREKEKNKIELQNAHDQLEIRVKERTEQLKIQIVARKESELQFKGVLAERTRLAQELHDTLEQTLASIALQLDTSAKLTSKSSDAAAYHFELARNILAQSQVDVRRSVWDLRARALEQFDLRGALVTSSEQITEGTSIRAEVHTKGKVRPLPEIIEDNLLRIAQEAVTNIVKHSGATRACLGLEYGSRTVALLIEDDGNGFAVDNCAGPRDGHFGLLGISERTQRLRGQATVVSTPGSGTTIRIVIPTESVQEDQWPASTALRG